MPGDKLTTDSFGGTAKQFRLYTRGTGEAKMDIWTGRPPQMSTRLSFRIWDGSPQFEDHCD